MAWDGYQYDNSIRTKVCLKRMSTCGASRKIAIDPPSKSFATTSSPRRPFIENLRPCKIQILALFSSKILCGKSLNITFFAPLLLSRIGIFEMASLKPSISHTFKVYLKASISWFKCTTYIYSLNTNPACITYINLAHSVGTSLMEMWKIIAK